MFDVIISGGRVVDGTGLPAFRADVAILDGCIARIGAISEPAKRVIDATGLVVAPGFIDIHTHFDAQLSWDSVASPMLEHGVTTIVTGNCSLSLAPIRADQRGRLSRMFGQIEQLPQVLFDEGVDWSWETFAEWTAARRGRLGINLAPLVGHSALRMFAMGDAAHERTANDEELTAMQAELDAALKAGAVGLSVSTVDVDEKNQPVPSRLADDREIDSLCEVLGRHGAMLQIVPEYWSAELMCQRIDELADRSRRFAIPTTFSPLIDATPGLVETVLPHLQTALATGARVYAQVQPRGLDVNFKLSEWNFALYRCSGWSRILRMTDRAEQIAAYSHAETRAKLVSTAYPDDDAERRQQFDVAYISAVGDDRFAHLLGRSLADLAAERGVNSIEAMLDLALADNLDTRFTRPPSSNVDIDRLTRMLRSEGVLIGASDSGAHVRGFSTYGDTAVILERFVRDSGAFRLEDAVKRLTSDQAAAWNLPARGLLRPGAPADVVVFDPETVSRGPELDLADMPTGCARYLRSSVGVAATLVNGAVAWTSIGGYESTSAGALTNA